MIRFSICGAASYACGELLRLMVNHPPPAMPVVSCSVLW